MGLMAGMTLGLACLCSGAQAQGAAPTDRTATQADMAMPDDLGAPLPDASQPAPELNAAHTLSVSTPIAIIAANSKGRAILQQDMPGLCERPEFVMFKGMSPAKLAVLSGGRISTSDLVRLQTDLLKVDLGGDAPRPHSVFTRGGQTVGRFSKAVYHHMAGMIASL